jgi:TBC1 domain family protein 5
MFINIYFSVLSGDYTTCMTYLMRYPGAVDITYIIEHALFLRDPQVDIHVS